MRQACLILSLSLVSLGTHAGGYTEGADLSNDWLNPTVVSVGLGSNIVRGSSGYNSNNTSLDRDFLRIDIAPGQQLDAIVVGPATQVGGAFSFFGVSAGPVLTVDPTSASNGSALLGWHLYGTADKGRDILPDIGLGQDKIGFSGALGAGSYTFWIQELAPAFPNEAYPPYPYEFDFQISAVPEPASALMLVLGLGALSMRRRSR